MLKFFKQIYYFPRKLAILLLNFYQFSFSPDHSAFIKARYPYGFCRHYPSCSQYAKQALEQYGLLKGAWLGIVRILKCNPWTEPKIDLISSAGG